MIRPSKEQEQTAGELLKWITNYVAPVFFATEPPPEGEVTGNGTVSFVDCGELVAVTNDHVLKAFEKLKQEHPRAQFQFSDLVISVKDRLLSHSKKWDLATFSIKQQEIELIKKQAVSPSKWPPIRPAVDDVVLFAGYPQIFRKRISVAQYSFEIIPILELIKSVSEEHITVWFDRDNWKKYLGRRELHELTNLGGFSGAAAFVPSKSTIMRPELVGFLYERLPELDLVLIRHADLISVHGTILERNS